ncbi:AAA-ATPase At3g28580-like [Humulus lupulus]|uniref:AAA-ATPase At3g28580-like n=1 Tax=Humulus lupulus TaxID=3486 RepID=UPI002B40E2F2|nr:AAA-ATPase At3g28580-like [Humulus lupulus]
MNLSMFSLFLAYMNRFNSSKSSNAKVQPRAISKTSQKSLQTVPSTMAETWATLSSTIASIMFAWAIVCQYSPYEVRHLIDKFKKRLKDYLNPYIQISIHEFTGDRMKRSEGYNLVEAYLSCNTSRSAKRLRADLETDGESLVLSMDDYEKITDEFQGVQVWWGLGKISASSRSNYAEQGKRYYKLTFHKKHRELVTKSYLDHVMKQGKEIRTRNRQRRLYTNCANSIKMSSGMWSHIPFDHKASFETMGLDYAKKKEIVEDLLAFSMNKEFYERAGKAWKRGYLLYGPPGTGKSTMIAAMANLLNYDVYDLELTAVKDNTDLRRLLIETTSKSIIVIEDIDCSLDLTGQRKEKKVEKSCLVDEKETEKEKEKPKREKKPKEEGNSGRVTLSGLLNFIDGIWSACGTERLIVFTTNHIEKLDPALIRRGRMDMHIKLSYCSFEGFKVLAKNYLNLENHQMFDRIESLIGETKMTPADVSENLMPKSPHDDPEKYLLNLIKALEEAKEAAAKKKDKKSKEIEPAKKEEVLSQDSLDIEKTE